MTKPAPVAATAGALTTSVDVPSGSPSGPAPMSVSEHVPPPSEEPAEGTHRASRQVAPASHAPSGFETGMKAIETSLATVRSACAQPVAITLQSAARTVPANAYAPRGSVPMVGGLLSPFANANRVIAPD